LARAWAGAVGKTSYLPMDRGEIERYLADIAERLDSAARTEPFVPAVGHQLGADLAAIGLAAPEALGRTVEILVRACGDDPETLPRLASLLGELTTGFARAQRDRTLAEQEAIRQAAVGAEQRAEQALRISEARFRRLALHDPLTELPNRTQFTHRLAQATTDPVKDRRVGVCFIDLDGFKAVNDRLGHLVGDRLLAAVARRLAPRAIRDGYLLARLGGDEFVALVDDCPDAAAVVGVAEGILAALKQPFEVDGHRLSVSASIGIVERPATGTDPTDLMRAADITLHWAKSDGRGRWKLFDPERGSREMARYALSADLPEAVQQGEFELEYQPLVAFDDGTVRGVEALARWRHPRLGMLQPDEFIGLAEESGVIIQLGGQLLERACREAAGWDGGSYVSVNLAVRQIRQPDLTDRVVAALAASGLPPHRLQLEITESQLMPTDGATRSALNTLAALGVQLVIDDFGTGYANLSYLRDLPVHGLKLDATFVAGLSAEEVDHDDEAILVALLSLAHALRLTVTAEGVEGPLQARRLAELGCDTGQGWYLGRPMSAKAIADLFAA
jgi:diguanylate cyclase (GGDEF)-like protein